MPHERSLSDYGLAMPESDLRQCVSGRRILAIIMQHRREQARMQRRVGLLSAAAAANIDRMIAEILATPQ